MKFRTWLLGGLLLCATQVALAKPVALLIGINAYENVGQLEGAVSDVRALQKSLVERWNFDPANIVTLTDGQATHDNILKQLAALRQRSAPGDFVLVYFSGHGTSALDTHVNLPLPYSSGAFVPVDAPSPDQLGELARQKRLGEVLIIGQTHLRPLFLELEKNRNVMMIADSCYSGNLVRSITPGRKAHFRQVPITFAGDAMMQGGLSSNTVNQKATAAPYPYQRVMFLSAASDREPARDIQNSDLIALPTVDNRPHGALTDTLLRVLNGQLAADSNGDGKIDYGELHQAVLHFMEEREYGHTPQRLPSLQEDTKQLAAAPLFDIGTPKGGNKPVPALGQYLRLRVDPTLGDVRGALANLNGIQLVPPTEQAALQLVAVDNAVELQAGSGDPIARFPGVNAALLQRLRAEVWWRNLVSNNRPEFNVRVETDPATRGNTFVAGETFAFNVQSDAAAHLLILDIDAGGNVSVLYPQKASEEVRHPARQMLVLPGSAEQDRIVVTPPFGLDQVVVIALPRTPKNWYGVSQISGAVPVGQPVLKDIERLLSEQNGHFAWQAMSVRTYPKR